MVKKVNCAELEALDAARAINEALGDTEATYVRRSDSTFDSFFIPFGIDNTGFLRIVFEIDGSLGNDGAGVLTFGLVSESFNGGFSDPYAKFTAAAAAPTSPTSTPEPTLMFGFITLGGLMLGSKRKTKG